MKAIKEEDQFLIFRVGSVMCCVSACEVDSIVNAQILHKVPHQSDSVAGMLQYRGNTVSIIDVFKKFEFASPQDPQHGRFIMAYTRHGLVGYWVDDVLEIISDYDTHWSAPPMFVDGNIFDKTLIWNDQLVLQTDFDRLFAMFDSGPLQQWVDQHGLQAEIQDVSSALTSAVMPQIKSVAEPEQTSFVEQDQLVKVDEVQKSRFVTDLASTIEPMTDLALTEEVRASQEESSTLISNTAETQDSPDSEFHTDTGALDTLSDNTVFDKTSDKLDEFIKPSSSVIHLKSEITLNADSVSTKVMPMDKVERSQENTARLDTAIHQATKKSSKTRPVRKAALHKSVELQNEITEKNKKLVNNTQTKPEKETIKQKKKLFQSATQKTVYDNVKLYLQPTTQQLQWSNDPYSVEQRKQLKSLDLEKFFEEKIGAKVKEYFESVESSKLKTEISADSNLSKNVSQEQPKHAARVATHSDNESAEIQLKSHTTNPEEAHRKREESILKIISRIEQNNPKSPAMEKMRLIASVLVVASILLVLQHFDWLPGVTSKQEIPSLELLSESRQSSVNIIDESQHTVVAAIPDISLVNQDTTESTSTLGNNELPQQTPLQFNKHIVVNGDTLWNIADFYLKDPFRYPDLAQWSHITNPDLIYPGDEVKYKKDKK